MKLREKRRGAESMAERFINAPLWSGSFYADNSLNLLRERYNELLLERKRQVETSIKSVQRAESMLRSTALRLHA